VRESLAKNAAGFIAVGALARALRAQRSAVSAARREIAWIGKCIAPRQSPRRPDERRRRDAAPADEALLSQPRRSDAPTRIGA